jgi:hypothetical protein
MKREESMPTKVTSDDPVIDVALSIARDVSAAVDMLSVASGPRLIDVLWDCDSGQLESLRQQARALHAIARDMRSQIVEMRNQISEEEM